VIVTGGSKGIGAGCARVFGAEGGKVAVLARGREAGEAMAAEVSSTSPGRAIFIPCDVSKHEQIKAAVDKTIDEFGRLDCIINNAGWHPAATTLDDMPIDDFESLLRLNFISTVAGAKYALPHLRETKGTIINMASMVGILGQDKAAAYCSTKAAQIGFTKALAVEVGADGIRVNAILPGNVDTPMMREWAGTLDDPQSALDRVAKLQVFGRMATSEEIGRIALFLATEDSSFLTGQAIEAEGGASLDY
jgi:NAD(P)-dependent dehydrogenase (short-subunit alcohol dehydrogenase family)